MGIHSPSRLFAAYGDYMMQGLEGGIIGGQDAPLDRIKSIAGAITRALAMGEVSKRDVLAVGGPCEAAWRFRQLCELGRGASVHPAQVDL